MVGLQGSGKTTSTAKIAKRLTDRSNRKVLMASLDTRRPAAMEQLATLGSQVGVETLPIVAGQCAVQIARRAMEAARLGGYDVVMLDTAGRVTLDEALMAEVAEVKAATRPHEVLLVADSLTGQDAVNTAKAFDERVGLTGIVLTRADGDGRGGAALSMRAVTGKPIKLLGTGEKMDALEDFDPRRVAGRILGMGDVVSLVEKAVENIDAEKAMAAAERMRKGQFDLDDLRMQLDQMEKLGGLGGLMGMLPGVGKMKNQMAASGMNDSVLKRQKAIIDSMTRKERRNPKLLDGSRRKRIAAGSGTKVEDVNKLMKMHRQMADMMKAMGGAAGKRGPMAGLANMFGMGGGMGGGGMGAAGWAAVCRAPSSSSRWRRRCRAASAAAVAFPEFPRQPARPCRAGFRDWASRAAFPACRASRRRRSDDPKFDYRRADLNRQAVIPDGAAGGDPGSFSASCGERSRIPVRDALCGTTRTEVPERKDQCPSRSVSPAAAPRSVPITASSSPTRARRAMAASSRRSAPSTR